MIEIFVLITLSRQIGAKVAAKGHNKLPYQLLLFALWFGGEIGGGIVGALISVFVMHDDEPSVLFIYLFALAGAVVGAVIAHAIAGSLRPVDGEDLRTPDYPTDADRRFGHREPDRDDITGRPAPRSDDRFT